MKPTPTQQLIEELDEPTMYPRELSWLNFNARVLQEAKDRNVPLIQRVRYLGIFSNNLDEFFRVRVAEVRRWISLSSGQQKQQAKKLLAAIQFQVLSLQQEFDAAYSKVLRELYTKGIFLINERQLESHQLAFVESFFHDKVLPELEPILLRDDQSIPLLTDESL